MKKILITGPFRESDLGCFNDIEGCELIYEKKATVETLKTVEGVLGWPDPLDLSEAANVKWLQTASAGVDNFLRVPGIFDNGLTITNLSGAFGQSISEFVLTYVLMLYKKAELYRDNQRMCLWQDEGVQDSPVGKNLLILGAGNIGSDIAKLFRPFGCHITGVRRTPREIPAEFDEMITLKELDEVLPEQDIIACALPETPETHKLINEERLKKFKDSAILVNVGRGGLIDTDALCKALSKGRLWGAALDVTDPEPLPADHPIWKVKNAIITPHITGGSIGHLKATEEKLIAICRENLIRFTKDQPLLNVVDPSTGYRKVEDRY